MAFEAGPEFGVRVAGIAVGYLEALRFPRTWTLVDEVVRLGDRLTSEGQRLADALHPVIGGLGVTRLRHRLVALRRDLFHARLTSLRVWSDELRAVLPEGITNEITAWRNLCERHTELEETLAPVLAGEITERTIALREAVALPAFRQGLAQSSPSLSAHLDQWLITPHDSAPARRTALRLTKYLARAVMKTSPYATFTATGLGRWSESAAIAAFSSELSVAGVAEIDRYHLNNLWTVLAAEPGTRKAVGLRVNPSATIEDGRLWFLGREAGEPLLSCPGAPDSRRYSQYSLQRPAPPGPR